jgi:hypothetical protein
LSEIQRGEQGKCPAIHFPVQLPVCVRSFNGQATDYFMSSLNKRLDYEKNEQQKKKSRTTGKSNTQIEKGDG